MPWRETSPMDTRTRFGSDDRLGLYSRSELCTRYGISRKTGYKWLARYHKSAVNLRWYSRCAWESGIPASPRPRIHHEAYHTEYRQKSQYFRYGGEFGGRPAPSSRDPDRRAKLHRGAAKQAGLTLGPSPRTPLPARAVARCMLRPGRQE